MKDEAKIRKRIAVTRIPGNILKNTCNNLIKGSEIVFHHDNNDITLKEKKRNKIKYKILLIFLIDIYGKKVLKDFISIDRLRLFLAYNSIILKIIKIPDTNTLIKTKGWTDHISLTFTSYINLIISRVTTTSKRLSKIIKIILLGKLLLNVDILNIFLIFL